MSRDPNLVDSDDIIRALADFHTDTDEGAKRYPILRAIADGAVTSAHVRSQTAAGRKLRGDLVVEACRLQRTATSTTQGDVAAVPYFDGREFIRWSDFHAGLMPEGTRQATP